MISFPKENNIYLFPNPNGKSFPDLCIKITKIHWNNNKYTKLPTEIEMDMALVDNKVIHNEPESIFPLLKPYPLNNLTLLALGFYYDITTKRYRKTYSNKNNGEILALELSEEDETFTLHDSNDSFDKDKNNIIKINALHKLQEYVRKKYNSELPIDLNTCNHSICLLYSMNSYIAKIDNYLLKNNNCCYIEELPEILRENILFPMSKDDISLVTHYLTNYYQYTKLEDQNGNCYLAYLK